MELMDGLLTRRSVRVFKNEKVSEETIDKLARAGMFAPSARNQQPWIFVTTNNAETLKRISEAVPTGKMASGAAFAVAVCVDESALASPDYFIQDCSACVQNVLLAAHAEGLGAVWVGMHPKNDREQAVRDIFGIPSDVPVAALVVGGVPAEKLPVADRFKADKIRHERW